YDAIHSAWFKAIKTLPDYSIVHKQDWFIKENYSPDLLKEDQSFLSRSFERQYDAIHSAWFKAIKTLPDYSIVHKQDWFIKENY
ncbi:hypothetical protein BOQ62_00530, partial [Chryseobacterium sp. CH21]|uniref:hypothetical protein n=1 Tax=Chryseobacterium sp. CH21 TaxID=713556 RepID=UPI0010279AE4